MMMIIITTMSMTPCKRSFILRGVSRSVDAGVVIVTDILLMMMVVVILVVILVVMLVVIIEAFLSRVSLAFSC